MPPVPVRLETRFAPSLSDMFTPERSREELPVEEKVWRV
jgi:hypothetical protein